MKAHSARENAMCSGPGMCLDVQSRCYAFKMSLFFPSPLKFSKAWSRITRLKDGRNRDDSYRTDQLENKNLFVDEQ